MKSNLKTKGWANPISVSVMLLAIILSLALFALHRIELSIIFMVALGLLSVSMRIADQWEHAVVLRMGKFQGLKGPGVFFILPIIDSVSAYVDQRVRVIVNRSAVKSWRSVSVSVKWIPRFIFRSPRSTLILPLRARVPRRPSITSATF